MKKKGIKNPDKIFRDSKKNYSKDNVVYDDLRNLGIKVDH
jgi:hypothetical protein